MSLEAQTIAAMLSDDDCLNEGMANLKAEWFSGKYKHVFNKLKEMYSAGKKIDVVTAAVECKQFANGTEWLLLESMAWNKGTVKYATEQLRRVFTARKLRELATDIVAAVDDGDKGIDEIVTTVEDAIYKLSAETDDVKILTPHDHAVSMMQTLERRMNQKSNGGISTSFSKLNNALNGGFLPGQLIIIAAATGRGKTAFAMNLMRDVAIVAKQNSLYINTEMGAEQMDCRWEAILAKVEHSKIASGTVDDIEFRAIMQSLDHMKNSGFHSVTVPDLNMGTLASIIKRFKAKTDMKFCVVDYVGRMDTSDPKLAEWQVYKTIAKKLKTLAQETQSTIIMLAQVSETGQLEGAKGMKNEADLFGHLREMNQAEMAANNGFNYALQLDKNRDGARGVIPLFFDAAKLTFRGVPLTRWD